MNIEKITIPIYETNCYIIRNNNECIIFDCGGLDEIYKYLKNNYLTPKIIFLTHGHYDHISAISFIKRNFKDTKVIAYKEEKEIIEDPNKNLSDPMFGAPYVYKSVEYKEDGEIINIFNYDIKIIKTPGHTIGSCCYYIEKEKTLFAGDTLFYETYGRYDLPTGSLKDIINSVGVELMKLPDNTKVYTGHGIATTIGHEREKNELTLDYVLDYGKKLK